MWLWLCDETVGCEHVLCWVFADRKCQTGELGARTNAVSATWRLHYEYIIYSVEAIHSFSPQ